MSARRHERDTDVIDGPRRDGTTEQRRQATAASLSGVRGQTTLDFAIGISVFLLVMLYIFLFMPGLLQPFVSGPQEETVAANRVADHMATGMLADPRTPYVLNRTCTIAFFEDTSPSACTYSGSTVTDRIGVDGRQHVNVTLRGNVTGSDGADTICWDDSANELVEVGDSGCSTKFTVGPAAAVAGTTVNARRVVTVDTQKLTLIVEMW
jgi:hypothetical protein